MLSKKTQKRFDLLWLGTLIFIGLVTVGVLLTQNGCAVAQPTEPPGYAQSGPNPLEGDHYGDTREVPKEVPAFVPVELDPDDPILRCSANIEIVKAVIRDEMITQRNELARAVQAIRKDGREIVIIAFYPITQTHYNWETGAIRLETKKYATIYLVDLNSDGEVDQVFTDKGGQGKCEDIKPYETGGKDSPKKGEVSHG